MARKKAAATVKIRLIRSATGSPLKVKKVVKGLGLRKIDQTVERPDDDATRGMIAKVPHLVEVTR
jgi:large subunit ribosomal protein L30